MKIKIILLVCCLNLIQINDSVMYRAIPRDEVLEYEPDKRIQPATNFFDFSHFHFEQVDDDKIELDGYIECIKSMDPKLPLTKALRTQILDRGSWIESPLRLWVPNLCPEFLNTDRFWYNITKLFTQCPPQKGDRWVIQLQSMDVKFNLPPSFPIVPTKVFVLFTQGVPGMEVTKFGYGLQLEFVPVQ